MKRTEERNERKVRIYDRGRIQAGQTFETSDHAHYQFTEAGAIVRLNKDRTSGKQRKKARREAKAVDARVEAIRQDTKTARERWAESDRLDACQNGAGTGVIQ